MINTDIYGLPENWTNAQYLTFAKYANFGTAANPQNTLLEGSTAGKTPTGELVENSICTQALGIESLYCNVVWVHDYGNGQQYVVDEKTQVPYFYAECVTTDSNVQNGNSHINPNYNCNSWSPYITDNTFQNKSAYSKPVVEYQPKKIIYRIFMTVCDANGNTRPDPILLDRADLPSEQAVLAEYPYITNVYMRVYIDSSNTDTPQRSSINSNSLFGVCPNININADTDDIDIDYAFFRSCMYNHIPIYGCFGISNYFDDYYTACLCDPADIVIDSNNVSARHLWNNDFKEFLIKQAACFGGFVYISNSTGVSILEIALDSEDIICGILDADGVGHGDYTRGAANRTNSIWDWQTNRDSPFDPYKIPDPTIYNDKTVFGDNTLSTTFVQYYAMNKAGLDLLCTYIYNYINSIDTNVEDINKAISKTFYTNNPLDTIISLKMFPFNITDLVGGAPQNVKLGHLSTGGAGYKLNGNYTVVDLGSYDCYPKFGNCFLDYSPYTYYELIIPFCGSTRLDPAQFMGKTLRLKMAIDLYTGACTCYILANNLCIDSLSGNCSIDMAITGIQSADFQNSMQNAITNVKNARINQKAWEQRGELAVGVVGKSIFGKSTARLGNVLADLGGAFNPLTLGQTLTNSQTKEVENIINLNQAEYNLQHMATPFSAVGSQSAANSRMEELQARLIIYRPEIAPDFDPQIYADTYGYATLENDTLNKYSGLTVAKINLAGVRCSDEERQMIENLFANGVYL